MAVQQFSLRDTFGAGQRDQQLAELREQDLKSAKRGNQAAEVFQTTARQAVDPQTGEYSITAHMRALESQGFPKAAETLRDQALERLEKNYEYLQHSLPFLDEKSYPAWRKKAVDGGLVPPDYLPEQYDPQFLAMVQQRMVGQLEEIYGELEQVAEGPGGAAIYGQREEHSGKLANVTTIKPPASSTPNAPSGYRFSEGGASLEAIPGGPADEPQGGALKAADSNTIFRQAVELFGGTFGPDGRITGLNREQSTQVQQIAARASEIFAMQGVPHAVAVRQALQEMQGAPAPQPTDGPVQIQSAEDYAALPSGAQYIDPNGQLRTKR